MLPCDALVVDDDRDGRTALAQVLEAHGYTVREAENGKAALEMIAERLPCVMLLDLEMPVMSGWEVLASLQRANALDAMKVVVISAAASPPPGVSFVRKPCRVDVLLDLIGEPARHGTRTAAPPGHP